MTSEAFKEILFFALLGFIASGSCHGHYWLFMSVAFAAYLGLTALSAFAFRRAVKAGLVTRSAKVRTAFNVNPMCKTMWLVRRHILVTPGSGLVVPTAKLNN